jgi:hypothetical protein
MIRNGTMLLFCLCLLPCIHSPSFAGGDALALRVQTLTVPPATQPLVHVTVRNLRDAPFRGTIGLNGPPDWQLAPAKRELELKGEQTETVPFSIEQGRNVAANEYAFRVTASCETGTVIHEQKTFVASAPYFKPEVDGDPEDWKDAIPITFRIGDHKTVVSTYWNRRRFSMLVAVQEDRLVSFASSEGPACDAVQLALSPLYREEAVPGQANRFEFLLVADEDGGRCFQLAEMETPQRGVRKVEELEPLAVDNAELVVQRVGEVTYYECSLPFAGMRNVIRPSEGREFLMSVLVHDPDGTGLRDLGAAAGLWPSPGDSQAWSRWPGVDWPEQDPRPPRVRWGFCASKY